MNYLTCQNLFASAKDKEKGKPLASNTRLHKSGDNYHIRLYDTDIMIIRPDDTLIVNHGGYMTQTTKSRLNDYIPVGQITQNKKTWYYRGYPFFNGMIIDQSGVVLNPLPDAITKKIDDKKKKLDKMIKKYIDGFCQSIVDNGLEYPGGGDCWFCLMTDTENGQSLGDVTKNYTHIFDHFKENYFVPSLLFNAIKSRGYKDPTLIFHMIKTENPKGTSRFNNSLARQNLRYYFRKHYQALLSCM